VRPKGNFMLVARITVDGRDYYLPSREDALALMARVTEQVRTGGGFVDVVRTATRTVSVLVSPGSTFTVDLNEVEDEPPLTVEEIQQSWLDPFDFS